MDRTQRLRYCDVCDAIEMLELAVDHGDMAKSQFLHDSLTELAARLLTCANKLREPGTDA